MDHEPFSVFLAVRDTDDEYEFILKSLPSAIKLRPAEIIFGLDAPISQRMMDRIVSICKENSFENYNILAIEKTSDWNFQLAKVHWNAYKAAKYDKVFAYDVDSIIFGKNPLEGLPIIGKDNVAVYSFTKRLKISNLQELFKYLAYRYHVFTTKRSVFSGNYWIYRPYFFKIVDEEGYKKIYNSVDGYLQDTISKTKYKMVTSKRIGVKAMTPQNEDYPWRQFQFGIWIAANEEKWLAERRRLREIRNRSKKTIRALLSRIAHYKLWDIDSRSTQGYLHLRSILYGQKWIEKGYYWAKDNSHHKIVEVARQHESVNTFAMLGAKFMPTIEGLDMDGTGSETRQHS
jgi:hypothetical protein